MNVTAHRRILTLILVVYMLLAITYSVVTPIFEASDELWHYPMVRYLAQNGLQLPPQDPANPGPWRQEGSQPPLYYLLAAALTAGIDTADMDDVRRVNPHADIGVVRPDGNANMIVHRAGLEAFPWRGTALAVHIIRLFSVALGLGTVLVTYQLARAVFPGWLLVALGAAALNAFLPMFLFISGSVNNDNLSNLLGNLLTLLIVRLLKDAPSPSSRHDLRDYAIIGVVAGAGLLSKLNIGFLIPLVALALLVASLRRRCWRPLVIGGAVSGGLTILIAGWWYQHNWQLYGDPTGLNMFLQMVGRRAVPANPAQLWSERHSFTQAYWGFFGGVNVPLPDAVYLIFNIVGGLGLLGAGTFIIYAAARRSLPNRETNPLWLPAAVTIIWPVVTFISYLRWTAETPASQGRLVFGALSALSLWMAVGLLWWLPRRARPFVMGGAGVYFFAVAALAPFLVIAPAYRKPPPVESRPPEMTFYENKRPLLALLEGAVLQPTIYPEQYVLIETAWEMAAGTERDWSLFVHLVTPDGVIVGQRDIYPGQGTLATSDLPAGQTWRNPIAIWLPPTAYAPMTLDVALGWYHHPSGERLHLADSGETWKIGQVEVLPRESGLNVPNPISINFENQIELVGYALTDLSPAAGSRLELTLYWRALSPIPYDYKVFANVLDPATLTKYAASDGMPAQWQRPTTTWMPDEIIEDVHILNISPETPPGIYELELGLYREAPDGTFPRLRIVTADGGMAFNFIYLNRVRVLPAEDS